MLPRVFIPQMVLRWDHSQHQLVPVYDFTSAAEFGTLTTILDKEDDPMFLSQLTPKIHAALDSWYPSDYFVAVGDPSVIAVCSGVILRNYASFNMLKWDKKLNRYLTLEIKP